MFSLSKFRKPIFLRDTKGSVSVEAVLIAPLLIWGMVATYVFYDGFRHKTRVQVAANTAVDVLSRRTATVTPQFVEDLNNIFDALATSRGTTAMRVTSVAQVVAGEDPVIAWSHGTRGIERATTLADLTGAVPPILTGEAALVLETFGNWTPPFSLLGMERMITSNAQVTSRPRFVPWLHFEGAIPVFETFDPEWSDPNNGYDQTLADPFMPTSPGSGGGTGGTTTGGTTSTGGTGGTTGGTTDPTAPSGGTGGGGGSTLGNSSIPYRQVGLWEFDNASDRNRDEAVINNQAIPVGLIGLPQWNQNEAGLYNNDGGYHLDNCVASSSPGLLNNDNRRQIVIPWNQTYDLTSATLRMVFRTDGLPANNSYGYNPSDRTAWWDSANNSAWALFSRDAVMQNEPGHFSAFVMGDGAVLVRFQVWSNQQFYGAEYAGTNFFLYAPPGSVQPNVNYDMQITFDHDRNMMDLYLNGERMDRREDVPITLAGNREYWQLGGSAVHTSQGQYNTPDWSREWFCGSIFHFEIWEGAFTPREIELQTCAPEPYSEEWYEYFYINMGRYPLASDEQAVLRDSARCDPEPVVTDPTPTPPPPVCTPQTLANMAFEDSVTTGWSSNTTSHATALTRFLGRFGQNQSITYTRALPSGTTETTVAFDLLIIDSWDGGPNGHTGPNGDLWQLLVNNELITSQHFIHTFSSGTASRSATRSVNGVTYNVQMELVSSGSNVAFSGWNEQVWRVTLTVTNPPLNFVLGMRSELNSDISDESWGIDNFTMTVPCGDGTPPPPAADYTQTVNIPYYWGSTYENWFTRPSVVPYFDWNLNTYNVSGDGNPGIRNSLLMYTTSGLLGWDGMQMRLTTPAPGQTSTVTVLVSGYTLVYNFVRASNPS